MWVPGMRGIEGRLKSRQSVTASGTDAVQHDLVALELEAVRHERFQVGGTAVELEEPITRATHEVVVVCLAGHFITGRLAGKVDGDEPSLLGESLEVAVHGGNSEAGHGKAGGLQDLGRAERAAGIGKGIANGAALNGIPFHDPRISNHSQHCMAVRGPLRLFRRHRPRVRQPCGTKAKGSKGSACAQGAVSDRSSPATVPQL
jgi:hypothetical protein